MTSDEHPPAPSAWAAEPPLPPADPQHLPPPFVAPPAAAPPRGLVRRILGPLAILAFVGFKWLKIAFVALKSFKLFGTAVSMLVSIGAYALLWGWRFAAGFVLLIFVHELGHAIQLRREGVRAGLPVFIPFLGAAIVMKEMPRDAAMEARVGIAGPILGTIGALATYVAALQLDSDLLQALAFTGFFLNLFNLVPLSPLDGGRIVAALSPRVWLLGVVLMVGLVLVSPNPVLILIVVLGVLETWGRWKARHANAAYYEAVTTSQRTAIALAYVGLIVALVVLMEVSHLERALPA